MIEEFSARTPARVQIEPQPRADKRWIGMRLYTSHSPASRDMPDQWEISKEQRHASKSITKPLQHLHVIRTAVIFEQVAAHSPMPSNMAITWRQATRRRSNVKGKHDNSRPTQWNTDAVWQDITWRSSLSSSFAVSLYCHLLLQQWLLRYPSKSWGVLFHCAVEKLQWCCAKAPRVTGYASLKALSQ